MPPSSVKTTERSSSSPPRAAGTMAPPSTSAATTTAPLTRRRRRIADPRALIRSMSGSGASPAAPMSLSLRVRSSIASLLRCGCVVAERSSEPVEPLAHERPHRSLGAAHRLGGFPGVEAREVPEHHGLPLPAWEPGDGLEDRQSVLRCARWRRLRCAEPRLGAPGDRNPTEPGVGEVGGDAEAPRRGLRRRERLATAPQPRQCFLGQLLAERPVARVERHGAGEAGEEVATDLVEVGTRAVDRRFAGGRTGGLHDVNGDLSPLHGKTTPEDRAWLRSRADRQRRASPAG